MTSYEGKYGESATCNEFALGRAVASEVRRHYEVLTGIDNLPSPLSRLIAEEVADAITAWNKEMRLIYSQKTPASAA